METLHTAPGGKLSYKKNKFLGVAGNEPFTPRTKLNNVNNYSDVWRVVPKQKRKET